MKISSIPKSGRKDSVVYVNSRHGKLAREYVRPRNTQATLVLCHAIFPKVISFGPASPPWATEALRGEALKEMEPARNLAMQAGVAATCVVEEGTPAGVILKVARRYEADLIILAPRERGDWARLFLGPTTAERVAREAESHVIVLRAPHE